MPFPSLSLSSDEQRLIDLVNQERAKAGLSPLQVDMDLVRVAKVKSHDMAEHNYFSHVSPTYGTVYNMLDQEGVFYTRAGENIARFQRQPGPRAVYEQFWTPGQHSPFGIHPYWGWHCQIWDKLSGDAGLH